jgi:uncharacterized repeat protein (TIGR01451 family)
MQRANPLLVALLLLASIAAPLAVQSTASALAIVGETFTGGSVGSSWTAGGGTTHACLTGATSGNSGPIGACADGPLDTSGNGALRLTDSSGNQSGFVIYNTPVSTADGLEIGFDMYQYAGSGADGISFFLIDGASSPTQPGATGGALGYASSTTVPGIVGGYVGIGFDRFGNFSSPQVGTNGPGTLANTITVRGSAATNYKYITRTPANGQLGKESAMTRTTAKRHVVVSVSTNNVMTISVDYNDGVGLQRELSAIDLNTINGAGSLPASFKFGFAASTGGSTNIHEIRGLAVGTLKPNVGVAITNGGGFVQGGTGQFTLTASNDAGAEDTTGAITVTDTLPAGLTPTSASGTGWVCTITGQAVSCTRPGTGANVLAPGASAPAITVQVAISSTAAASLNNSASLVTSDNNNADPSDTDTVSIANGSSGDADGVFNAEENGAPNSGDANNDGVVDANQSAVTSLLNPLTSKYAVLASQGCTGNSNVGFDAEADLAKTDGDYIYPAGLMDFSLTCGTPGATATVTHYYYGTYDPSKLVMRKYNATTNTYRTISGAVLSTVTIGGQAALKAVYSITDGGLLDDDGLANGTIVDPAGPALQLAAVSAPSTPSVTGTTLSSTTPSTPNTGLKAQSSVIFYAAAIIGAGLIGYEIRNSRFGKKKTYSSVSS